MRALVTGVGGGGGGEQVIKALRLAATPYDIVGTDVTPYSSGLAAADHRLLVPPATAPEYVDVLLQICRERVIQVVFHGTEVELRIHGNRPQVPPGVDLSAYRVVQEALTNVIKHAGPARATVDVHYSTAGVAVDVTDDGRGGVAPAFPGGHGLIGMRERVAVHGGELDAGPRESGGFRVVARFPLGER